MAKSDNPFRYFNSSPEVIRLVMIIQPDTGNRCDQFEQRQAVAIPATAKIRRERLHRSRFAHAAGQSEVEGLSW